MFRVYNVIWFGVNDKANCANRFLLISVNRIHTWMWKLRIIIGWFVLIATVFRLVRVYIYVCKNNLYWDVCVCMHVSFGWYFHYCLYIYDNVWVQYTNFSFDKCMDLLCVCVSQSVTHAINQMYIPNIHVVC